MEKTNIIVYGVNWCWDCRRTRKFLDKNNIPYNFVNIDQDPQAEKYVLTINKGMRSVPTILFQDSTTLVEPTNAELAQILNLNVSD